MTCYWVACQIRKKFRVNFRKIEDAKISKKWQGPENLKFRNIEETGLAKLSHIEKKFRVRALQDFFL